VRFSAVESDDQSAVSRILDVSANRAARKYSRSEIARRVLWMLAQPLYRFSPRPCFAWRRLVLRMMGASVGKNVHVYSTSRIYFPWLLTIGDDSAIGEGALIYNLGPVVLGSRTTISHCAHLCAGTHDYRDPTLPLLRPPIHVGSDAWVCASAFIGPGVTIGDGAVVGAASVVVRNVQPWTVVAGNPAKVIRERNFEHRNLQHS
jgi:putative colanic acid biosynthesis acetyltransferase WcaF